MKTKTLSAIFAFATLTTLAGSAVAGAHEGYYRAFYGKSDTVATADQAAHSSPSSNPEGGHAAYQRAIGGGTVGSKNVAELKAQVAVTASAGPDASAIYQAAFGSS